jgi:hypothetical protein
MLKLRSIGSRDYSVLEGEQRIGRIRFADERMPGVWLWNVTVHRTGGLPMGSSMNLHTAKADFRWQVVWLMSDSPLPGHPWNELKSPSLRYHESHFFGYRRRT